MSKITPKNLHYDTTLPPFLARMQANHAARDDRHEFDVLRPRKPRDVDADAEDEPVYFDEGTGESLTRGEWEERDKKEEGEKEEEGKKEGQEGGEEGKEMGGERRAQNIAVIGVTKKRKMGRVVGADEEGGEERGGEKEKDTTAEKGKKLEKGKGKSAKKGKKIKLSFGDDE